MNASAPVSDHYRKPLLEAAILQVMAIILAAMVLDGGKCLHAVMLSVLAHWAGAILILVRRPTSPTKGDLLMVGRGFLLLMLLTFILSELIWSWRWIWELRGIERHDL